MATPAAASKRPRPDDASAAVPTRKAPRFDNAVEHDSDEDTIQAHIDQLRQHVLALKRMNVIDFSSGQLDELAEVRDDLDDILGLTVREFIAPSGLLGREASR